MLRRTYLSLAMGAVLAACGGDSSTGPESANVTGTYALQTINGQATPVTIIQIATYRLEVVSGSLAINTNNTFSNTLTYRETDSGQIVTGSETCTGTYSRNGNSVTFNEADVVNTECGDTYTGTVSGNNLTVAYDATVQAVYRK
jgi:hypothetical protein